MKRIMIGIFDSGVGGLTVAKAIKKKYPEQGIVYFGDTARVPWGDKSAETVKGYAEEICNFFVSKNIKKVVIACNTASSLAGDHLKSKFQELEIIDVIEPTVEFIKNNYLERKPKIAVIGTKGVVQSGIYGKKIREVSPEAKVEEKACPLLVPLIEEGWHEEDFSRKIIEKYLKSIKEWKAEVVVLGCTHYPLIRGLIEEIMGPEVAVIDSATPIAEGLTCPSIKQKKADEFFFSDLSPHYEKLIKKIWGENINYEKLNLTGYQL